MADDLTNHESLARAIPSAAPKARRRARIDPAPRTLKRAEAPVQLLIFIDFDGVLHPSKGEEGAFCHLARLARCADELALAGVEVSFAISSSWRCFAPLEEILEALDQACPGFSQRVEGATGSRSMDPAGARRLEIYDYIAQRPGGAPASFAAVDDRLDLFGGEALRPAWLLLCDPLACFDASCAERLKALALALLALPEPQGAGRRPAQAKAASSKAL